MVFEMTTGGAVASSFILPLGFGSGLAYADSLIWVPGKTGPAASYVIGKFDPDDGFQSASVPIPFDSLDLRGFCEGGGHLWLIDGFSSGIFKFDKTGVEVGFYSPDSWGAGITWASGYLWMPMAPARIDAYDFN